MKIKGFVYLLLIALAIAVWLFSALRLEETEIHNLQIDLSRPLNVVWPCEVAIVGELGEKGLRIGANIGRGWRGEAAGHATYRFYIPANGTYTVWAYADWFDECANAAFIQFDDHEKIILGNDPIYGQWHWVRGVNIDLTKGTHNLTLSNHSDHIAIEKLFFSSSQRVTPQNSANIFSDIFYEGFDGCDQGNFSQWKISAGKWQVLNPFQEMDFNQNILVTRSGSDAIIICPQIVQSNMSIQVSIFHPDEPENQMQAGIRFGLKDPKNYYQLCWQPLSDSRQVQLKCLRMDNGATTVLTQFQSPLTPGQWHDITISLLPDQLRFTIDQQKIPSLKIIEPVTGTMALIAQDRTTVYFDNIHIRQSLKP